MKGEGDDARVEGVRIGSPFEKGSNKQEAAVQVRPGQPVQEEKEVERPNAGQAMEDSSKREQSDTVKQEQARSEDKMEERRVEGKVETGDVLQREVKEAKGTIGSEIGRKGDEEDRTEQVVGKEERVGAEVDAHEDTREKKPGEDGAPENEKKESLENQFIEEYNEIENKVKIEMPQSSKRKEKAQNNTNNAFIRPAKVIDLIESPQTSLFANNSKKTINLISEANSKITNTFKKPQFFNQRFDFQKNNNRNHIKKRHNIFSSQNKRAEGKFNRPHNRHQSKPNSNANMLVYSAFSNKGRGPAYSTFENSPKKTVSHAETQSYHISENASQKSLRSISLVGRDFPQGNLKNGDLLSDIESHQSFSVRGKGFRKIRGTPASANTNAPRPRNPKPVLRFNRPRIGPNVGVSPQIIETVNAEPSNIPDLVIPENEEDFRLPECVLQPFKSSYNVDDHKNTVSIAKRLKKKGSNPFRFREVKGLFGGFSHKDSRRFPQAKRFLLKSLRLLQRKQNRQFMSVGARSVCIDLMGDAQSFSEVKGFMRRPKTSNMIPGTVYDLLGDGRAKEVMSCLDDGGRGWNRGRLGNAQSKFIISLEGASVLGSVKQSERAKDDLVLGKREHLSLIEEVKQEDLLERVKETKLELGSFKKEERHNMSDPKIKASAMQMNFYSDSKNDLKRAKQQAQKQKGPGLHIDMRDINSPMRQLPKGFSSNLDKKVFEGGSSFYQKRSSQDSKNLEMSL